MKKFFIYFSIIAAIVLTLGIAPIFVACAAFTTNRPVAITNTVPYSPFYDTNALDFLSRSGCGVRAAVAVDGLVRELKAANLWTNFYALYPFVGGTSNSMAVNLISTNYTIVWHGTNTFDYYGVTGDGISSYGDTRFAPTNASSNSFSLYIWAAGNLDNDDGSAPIGVDLTNGTSGIIIPYFSIHSSASGGQAPTFSSFSDSYVGGSFIGSSYGSGIFQMAGLTNAFMIQTNAPFNYPFLVSSNIWLLGNNAGGSLDGQWPGTLRATAIGKGFTPSQSSNLFRIFDRFQSQLNRATP